MKIAIVKIKYDPDILEANDTNLATELHWLDHSIIEFEIIKEDVEEEC